jgi:hypothetical protein
LLECIHANEKEKRDMNRYQPRISKNADGAFYALVVRVEYDGEENVVSGFGRHFKTLKAAEKSASNFIAKNFG